MRSVMELASLLMNCKSVGIGKIFADEFFIYGMKMPLGINFLVVMTSFKWVTAASMKSKE